MKKTFLEAPLHFNTIVIGGGIVGAGVFRDLSLQGQDVLLIDKNDFSSQTSMSSSKMLHGGIRYLENMDFALVWEALHEKNLWLKLAPHLCYEKKFYLPIYKDSLRPKWMLRVGLFLYDLLSSFQNSPHSMANTKETIEHFKTIKGDGLQGSGIYFDAIVDDAKLTLEVIYDGLEESGSMALNYTEYVKHEHLSENEIRVTLKDVETNEEREFFCEDIVFATGPFTDKVLKGNHNINWQDHLLPSKGSHLWIKKEDLNINDAIVLTPNDGRVIFVIPQKNMVLVGTTEVSIQDVAFNQKADQSEVDYLIENLNQYFPHAKVTRDSIISSFSGIRPLVKEDSSTDRAKTARDHKYFQPRSNMHIIIGGKYTTFRIMAQDVSRIICTRHHRLYDEGKTLSPLRVKSTVLPFSLLEEITNDQIDQIIQKEHVKSVEDVIERRINNPFIQITDEQKEYIKTKIKAYHQR
ncbi:glycerol-3-phosphate dehydrogenase/oxidase [Halobacteriovorax sp. GB3]|uniref:glycerol-3-phosphate dehydrogenase/oxidase n=1 Tax=Halobacteriovorax sp. GB3 TaxID=2719615 RepID=UPI002361DD52|nr:glycerol-3-phosphate dehydrogenase/oxidase [Halobacteriovorax sp. GB3]MDD0853140.1 glycerol-3-phosphate dehydrogenase/oxidase [Halobacteriovorax sp. GB3]